MGKGCSLRGELCTHKHKSIGFFCFFLFPVITQPVQRAACIGYKKVQTSPPLLVSAYLSDYSPQMCEG